MGRQIISNTSVRWASVLGRGSRGGVEPWGVFKPGPERGFRPQVFRKVEEGMGEKCGESSEAVSWEDRL